MRGLVPRDFRAFWLGHHGRNRGNLNGGQGKAPRSPPQEMRSADVRAEPLLDVEGRTEDPLLAQRVEAKKAIDNMRPEDFGGVLEPIRAVSGKTPDRAKR